MKIITRENLYFELRIESVEELWMLTQIISPQDKIYAQAKRKVAIGNDKTKQITKLLPIELLVKKISFETSSLRITGEIQNETQYTAVGQTHSLNFSVGDTIKLQKNQLLRVEEQYLKKAEETKSYLNLILLVDHDEIIAIEAGDTFYSVVLHKKGLGSKKYLDENINSETEKFKELKELLQKEYKNFIIMGSPLTAKPFSDYIKENTNNNPIYVQWNDVSTSAVEKALSHLSKNSIIENSQLSKEEESISQLLYNIEKQKKYSYGFENTKNSVEQGAVEKLLLSTKYLDKNKEDNTYEQINTLMRLVEDLKGEILIINSKNTPGRQLDGLGGIAAILRY